MKKKGFTLIELLGVIIILGILLVIAIPTVTRYLKRGTVEYYHSLENEMKTVGMDYLETYRSLLPRQIGDVTVVELDELENNKYIDEVKDEDGKPCSGRVTVEKIKTGEYEYYSCLICGVNGDKYHTDLEENKECKYKVSTSQTNSGNYKVVVDMESPKKVCQGESFTLPTARAYYVGNGIDELVSDKVVGRPDSIDTKKLGTTKVKYNYHGASKEIEVTVEDCKNPSKTEVVLKYDNNNGSIYKGEWYSGNIYQKFKSTDYTGKGLLGSGIKEYQVSNDGEIFTAISGDSLIEENSGIHTKYVKSKDNADNYSEAVKYTFKIDKEVPTCGLKVTSGTLGNNNWYRSNVTVDWDYKRETISSIIQSNINTKSISSEGTTRVTGLVTDEAGNIGSCSIDVKIDKTNPVVTSSLANGTYTGKQNITLSATDSLSKVNLIYYEAYLDGVRQNYGSVTGDKKSISLDKSGKWDVYVRAYDYAGNASNGGVLKQYTYQVNLCPYSSGKTWEFNYTGSPQEFPVECNGTYKLEVWGAQGGYDMVADEKIIGGKGGYSKGNVYLTAGQKLYTVVGGKGGDCDYTIGLDSLGISNGGYNGGGTSRFSNVECCDDEEYCINVDIDACSDRIEKYNYEAGAGGGATHIATTNRGVLANYASYKSEILIVAGGGGGGYTISGYSGGERYEAMTPGAAGGGLTGGDYQENRVYDDVDDDFCKTIENTGGTQSTGYAFGQGGIQSGGGWYGGLSSNSNYSGAGGSGYIGGVTSGTTIVGSLSMPTYDGKSSMIGNTGNGHAKITLVSIN